MNNKNEIKLYNMMLPIWLLWISPVTWLFIIPLTLITDSAVILIALKFLKQNEIKQKYKEIILKVWLFGFVADIPGLFLMIASQFFPYSQEGFLHWWHMNMTNAVAFNPYENILSFLYVIIATFITFVLIYFLNLKLSLKGMDMDDKTKKRLALILAIFTTPWLFLFPSIILYT